MDADMQEEILEILGENPETSKRAKIEINSSVQARWQYWCKSGVPEKEWEDLLKKYEPEGVFKAAELNPEVRATLKDTQLKRDGFYVKYQNLIGAALTSLGAAISLVIKESEEPVEVADLVRYIFEAGKLLSEVHCNQTQARKAYIEPGLPKETTDVLKQTTADGLLYGAELSTKINQSKTLAKVVKTMKSTDSSRFPQPKNFKQTQFRRPPWTKKFSYSHGQPRAQQPYRDKRHFNNQKTYFNPKNKYNKPQYKK